MVEVDLPGAVAAGKLTPISLGPNCGVSLILDRLGLRLAAYPFDWLYSSLAMVEHCVDDDFRTFLDAGQIDPLRKRQSNHRFYLDTFNVVRVFNHHQMPKEMPHFERAVERFRTASRPVFIHITREEPDREVLARLRTKLRGPLLAYVVNPSKKQSRFREMDGVTVFKTIAGYTSSGFRESADDAQFVARLRSDLCWFASRHETKWPGVVTAGAA